MRLPARSLLALLLLAQLADAVRWRTAEVGNRWVTDGSRLKSSDPDAKGNGKVSVFALARRGAAVSAGFTSVDVDCDSCGLTDEAWLIPGRLLVGPRPADGAAVGRLVSSCGIDCFACLDGEMITAEGAANATALLCELDEGAVPRDALSDGSALMNLLDELIAHYEDDGAAVYIYSSAGSGRAAWVGACMLSLLRPDLDKKKVLDVVQSAHRARATTNGETNALSQRAPKTESQRRFVAAFVAQRRAALRLQNDMDMVLGGLPKAFL